MNLTEQQLQQLFQNSTKDNQSRHTADDCIGFSGVSQNRLASVESLMGDMTSAQAMKTAIACKAWSQKVAASIREQSMSGWFNWFVNPLKTTVTATAMALMLVAIMPQTNKQESVIVPVQAQVDVIRSIPFESEVLSNGSFEEGQDNLFGASFG